MFNVMTNCPNCGAPITGDQCEYCRTIFRDIRIEVEKITLKQELLVSSKMTEELYANTIKAIKSSCITANEARGLFGLNPIDRI